jgi:hypothetical protein
MKPRKRVKYLINYHWEINQTDATVLEASKKHIDYLENVKGVMMYPFAMKDNNYFRGLFKGFLRCDVEEYIHAASMFDDRQYKVIIDDFTPIISSRHS